MKMRGYLVGAVVLAQAAWAQSYVVQSTSQAYIPLTGGTSIVTSGMMSSSADDEEAILPIGFSFPYYGNTYSQVMVSSNGFVTFQTTASCGQTPNFSGCNDPQSIPRVTRSTGVPHLIIAPWWDDNQLNVGTTTSDILYKSNASQFELEFKNINAYSFSGNTYQYTVKLTLTASGAIQIHYGPHTGTNGTAAVGWENIDGTLGGSLPLPPSNMTCSTTTAACSMVNFPSDTLYTIGQPVQPDLTVQTVNLSSSQRVGANLQLSISPTFRNFGQNAASSFLWRAYLSLDRVKDASDIFVLNSSTPLSCPGASTVSDTAMATIPLPPNGNYYVIVEVDYTNVVVEGAFGEGNNFGTTANYFVSGLDLVATSITGPANSGPGNMMTVHLNYFNQGTDPVTQNGGLMGYRIYLSTDQTYQASDYQLYPMTGDATHAIAGGQTVDEDVTFTVPGNVPGGDFYYILSLDPQAQITETKTNNIVASTTKVNVRQADLVIKAVDLVDPSTGSPVRRGLFGTPARLKVTAANEGGADARNFKIGVVISADTNLSLLADTVIIEAPQVIVAQGTTQTFEIDFTMPLVDRSNQPFTTGNWYFYGLLDSTNAVTELSEFNNNMLVMGPALVQSPAPDLTVVRFDAPANAGVGEIAPIYRVFKNIGNQDSPEVKYRYYLSANTQITTDDLLVNIVNNNTMTDSGRVTLAVGQVNVATEFLQIPANLTPGTYYLGAFVDSDVQVTELDELNNGLGSLPVAVAPSALRISTPTLPDAVVGRPYSFQMSVQGDTPGTATTWALDPASSMPAGMSLSATGLISGSPMADSVTGITFVATNQGRSAIARLVLRVLPVTTQVEITTPSLPSVVAAPTLQYETFFGAAGGVKPYSWRRVPVGSEAFPNGITLETTGRLFGFPQAGVQQREYPVTIEVRDSIGSVAQRKFTMRVVSAGAILFTKLELPDGLVGTEYTTDISVKNADMSALAKPLEMKVVSGALPAGMRLSKVSDVDLLEGTPTEGGAFAFTLEVVDAKGRADSADFILRVWPPGLKIGANNLPPVSRPGDPIDFNFVVGGSSNVEFDLFSGTLPPGVHMEPDGHVVGTIEDMDSEGTFNFVVHARDGNGASGLGAFSIFVKRDMVRKTGCSSVPSSAALWLGLLVVPALLRRRRGLAGLALAAVVALPLSANAQIYLLSGPTPISYSSLSAATTVSAGATVPVPFPFYFYGQLTPSFEMSGYGYLTTTSNDSYVSNSGIPNSAAGPPANFIAPFWDSLAYTSPGILRYQLFGASPNRYLVFEWQNVASTAATTLRSSFEVILYEGTNEIRFAYAAAPLGTSSASVGIQKEVGTGLAGLACTTGSSGACSGASGQFPSGMMIQFQTPPELTISTLSMDQVGYAGVVFHANAFVKNAGGKTATQGAVRYFLSTNATYEAADPLIGDSYPLTDFPANSTTLVASTAAIPSATTPGNYFVLSQVDPDNSAAEQNEMNNFGPPQPLVVGNPTPDLVTQNVTAPATAAPGAMIQVGRQFTNIGNAAAGAFKYTWFLSDNSVVSISDTVLGAALQISDLLPMASTSNSDTVTLPANLPAGQYYLGACVNYDPAGSPQFGITEISQVNNCSQSLTATIVSSGALTIVTPATLPAATQYSPYGIRLAAVGGNGSYLWQLAAGAQLPPGLNFSAQGDLQGSPATTGTFSFGVKVTSGGTEAMQNMSLMVAPGNIPLAIVDQDLPAAEFGRAYDANLVAVGGKPPYVWKLKMDARLPQGLALSPEGSIEGRANESGDFSFTVELTDSMATIARKDLRVRVVNPTTLHIATSRLKTAFLKQDYQQQLQAVGGKIPYTWTLLNFQALPQNATEKPGMANPAFPDDFGIHIEDGNLDFLRGEPKQAGQYALTFKATDANGAEDQTTLLLTVSYAEPIAITTTALPDAFIGHDYAARLSHNRGKESTGVVFSLPCVQQAISATMFACAPLDSTQKLPDGLLLAEDGTLSGAPTDGNNTDQVYAFLVKVVDDAGRQDVRSLSIRVRPSLSSGGGGGCSGTGLEPLLLASLLALGAIRRKKARP